MLPSDFFATAEAIEQVRPATEALARSVVSRIYYGCHHEAVRFLDPAVRRRTPGHQSIIDGLHDQATPPASEHLRALRRLRELADYDLNTTWPPDAVRRAWDRAARLRRLLGTL